MNDDELIASFIQQYAASFAEQVEQVNGWPVSFTFPEPRNSGEREAFRLFIAELEQATGKKVRYTTQPGHA